MIVWVVASSGELRERVVCGGFELELRLRRVVSSGDCCCTVVFELRVPSLWAPSREGCVRRTSSAAQSAGECRRELADHRGTSRVQVTCSGLAGPVRSPRSRVIKTQEVQPDPLACEGVFSCVSFGLLNECCGAESEK